MTRGNCLSISFLNIVFGLKLSGVISIFSYSIWFSICIKVNIIENWFFLFVIIFYNEGEGIGIRQRRMPQKKLKRLCGIIRGSRLLCWRVERALRLVVLVGLRLFVLLFILSMPALAALCYAKLALLVCKPAMPALRRAAPCFAAFLF